MKMRHLTVGHSAASALSSVVVDSAMASQRRTYKPGTAVDYQESNSTSIGHDMGSGGAGGIASSAKQHDVTVIKGLGIGAVGHHQSQSLRMSPPACPLDIAAA